MKIIDTTLREGEQTPGVSFSIDSKFEMVSRLYALGVEEIELGVASPLNRDLAPLLRFARKQVPAGSFALWCRCREEDVNFAATLAPSVLSLSIPVSDIHLQNRLGRSRSWALNTLRKSLKVAHEAGVASVSVGLEDATRADVLFVRKIARTALENGAFRLRLADTVGIASPLEMVSLVRALSDLPLEIGVHCHNDFGMATANTIASLEEGALWGDATILGLGERAGNCRLEELVAFLSVRKKVGNYALDIMPGLSELAASDAGIDIPPQRPVIGRSIFECETGLHLQGLMRDPVTYEPFAPECVGKKRTILIGAKVGRQGVAASLVRLGLPLPDSDTLARLTGKIRSQAVRKRRPLHDDEIIRLACRQL